MESKELEIVGLKAKLQIISAESIEKDVKIKSKFEFCRNWKFSDLFIFLLDAEKENLKLTARLAQVESNDRMN